MVTSNNSFADRGFTPLFYQQWSDLLFVHWEIAPDLVQQRLPDGLTVETYGGKAWIGVVPFVLTGVRPTGFFRIPFFDRFLEVNLRTYVRDTNGCSGVWFFSLEANHALAVVAARRVFHLNYQHAHFDFRRISDEEITMRVQRHAEDAPLVRIHYTRELGTAQYAARGSLEEFLIERYRLFSLRERDGVLNSCKIAHHPYRLLRAQALLDGRELLSVNGFPEPDTPPAHVVAAMPVNVATDRLRHAVPDTGTLPQPSAVAAS